MNSRALRFGILGCLAILAALNFGLASADAATIVTAILIGDRAGLSDDVERRLQEAGTYHVIAISGGNVALLTAMCFAGARLLIRSARVVALVTIVAVAIYGWVVGADASVARAVGDTQRLTSG